MSVCLVLDVQEVDPNAKFVEGGSSRFDVMQGELGDCWCAAASSLIHTRPSPSGPQPQTYFHTSPHHFHDYNSTKEKKRIQVWFYCIWFFRLLAGLASLSLYPELLEQVVPRGQEFDANYCGTNFVAIFLGRSMFGANGYNSSTPIHECTADLLKCKTRVLAHIC